MAGQLAGQPIYILREGSQRTRGKEAQHNNIMAARAVATAVRTTLGPQGMDKMLVDAVGDIIITNDGATILQTMDIEHPAAKMIVEVAKTQDDEAGDGTTTAAVLAGEFLKNAEELLELGVHPTVIASGYRLAAAKAKEILKTLTKPVTLEDKDLLLKIAVTAITGKGAEASKDVFAILAVNAILAVVDKDNGKYKADIEDIKIEKKVGGSIEASRATGAKILTGLKEISESDLGKADLVEEKKIGEDAMTYVTGCHNPKAVSIILRGGTEHVVDEAERALHDALRVVGVAIEDETLVAGGGSPEVELALRLREYSATLIGREQLAVAKFAEALEIIPRTLAENAGLDPIDMLVEMRSQHEKGNKTAGLNVFTGKVVDMWKEGVVEPLRVKIQAISSATEAATMILRIDDVLSSKASPAGGMPPGGMGGGMGGMEGMG